MPHQAAAAAPSRRSKRAKLGCTTLEEMREVRPSTSHRPNKRSAPSDEPGEDSTSEGVLPRRSKRLRLLQGVNQENAACHAREVVQGGLRQPRRQLPAKQSKRKTRKDLSAAPVVDAAPPPRAQRSKKPKTEAYVSIKNHTRTAGEDTQPVPSMSRRATKRKVRQDESDDVPAVRRTRAKRT